MRVLFLFGAFGLALALPAAAQTVSADATVVLPSHPGEAVRITTMAQAPTGPGRLAQRYRGLRVFRDPVGVGSGVRSALVVTPTTASPSGTFIRRNGSHFLVRPGGR